MNPDSAVEQSECELNLVKRRDSAFRTTAGEGNPGEDVGNALSKEIIILADDTGVNKEGTGDNTGAEKSHYLPEVANVCPESSATLEGKLDTTAAKLQKETKKPLLNKTVQAMFYRAVGFSKPRKGVFPLRFTSHDFPCVSFASCVAVILEFCPVLGSLLNNNAPLARYITTLVQKLLHSNPNTFYTENVLAPLNIYDKYAVEKQSFGDTLFYKYSKQEGARFHLWVHGVVSDWRKRFVSVFMLNYQGQRPVHVLPDPLSHFMPVHQPLGFPINNWQSHSGGVEQFPEKPQHLDQTEGFRQRVVNFCENRGWKRIYENDKTDYFLKWCEINTSTNFQYFQEGKQLLNQIPNDKLLTTKVGLCSALKTHEQTVTKYTKIIYPRFLKMAEFYPETYRMDVKSERLAFFEIMQDGSIWISKPAGSNLGKGIFLLKCQEDLLDFREKLESVERNASGKMYYYGLPINRIVQRYLHKPLLLEGRKFDVRSYLLIACTSPHMIFFRHGYVKLACNKYDPYSDDLTSHLTNQFVQKKNPLYSEMKEDTVWSMEHLNQYINENYMEAKDLRQDWVFSVFEKRMQKIMIQCYFAVKGKLECKLGYFNLLGCDFMVDQNFKVWLLEMNANPSLQRHCEVLKTVIPKLVYEALDVVVEIFKKCSKGLKALPLQSQREFVLLYSGCHQEKLTKSVPRTENNISPILKQPYHVTLRSVKRTENTPMQKPTTSSNHVSPAKGLQKVVSLVPYKKLPAISLTEKWCPVKNNPLAIHQLPVATLGELDKLKSNRDVDAFKKLPAAAQLRPLISKTPHASTQQHPNMESSPLLASSGFQPRYITKMVTKSSEMKMSSKKTKTQSGDAA